MSKYKNKTQYTDASVDAYLCARGNEQQRADCAVLIEMISRITGEKARMWGESIVGFGSYHYTYASGHSGEAPLAGFAIRSREIVLYLTCELGEQSALLAKLGSHKMSKSCLYLKRLADIDLGILQALITASAAKVRARYT